MSRFLACLFCVFASVGAFAQESEVLLPGDKAPTFEFGSVILGHPAPTLQRGTNYLLYFWSQANFDSLEYDADTIRQISADNPGLSVIVANIDSAETRYREYDAMARGLFRGQSRIALVQDTGSQVLGRLWYKASLADSNISFFVNKHGYIGAIGEPEFAEAAFQLFQDDNLDMARSRKVRTDEIKARYAANAPLRQANSVIKSNIGKPEAAFQLVLNQIETQEVEPEQFGTLWNMLLAIAKWSVLDSGDPKRGIAFAQQVQGKLDPELYAGLSDWLAFEAFCQMFISPDQAMATLTKAGEEEAETAYLSLFLVLIDMDGDVPMRKLTKSEKESFAKTFKAIFDKSGSDLIQIDCLHRTIQMGQWDEAKQMAAKLQESDLLTSTERDAAIQAIDAARSFDKPFTTVLNGNTKPYPTGAEAIAGLIADGGGAMVSDVFEFAAAESLSGVYGTEDFEAILETVGDLYNISPGETPFLVLADSSKLSDEDMRTFFGYFTESLDLLPTTAVRIIRQYDGKQSKAPFAKDLADMLAKSEDYRSIYLDETSEFLEESLAMAELLIRSGDKPAAERMLNKCRQQLFEYSPGLSTTPDDYFYPSYLYYLSLVARAGRP
ncbi:MAG: hypothetical protein JNM28_05050 [Armatimonadetes bacterium]|nr:hypothetical protein [Armatimonadota bacterium]